MECFLCLHQCCADNTDDMLINVCVCVCVQFNQHECGDLCITQLGFIIAIELVVSVLVDSIMQQ